ncbi:hypothetical protein J6590_015434 [Homalodisca vitripennis]|nr:hypothetical protein J6590_015434 [Homalodisca vitripennis]
MDGRKTGRGEEAASVTKWPPRPVKVAPAGVRYIIPRERIARGPGGAVLFCDSVRLDRDIYIIYAERQGTEHPLGPTRLHKNWVKHEVPFHHSTSRETIMILRVCCSSRSTVKKTHSILNESHTGSKNEASESEHVSRDNLAPKQGLNSYNCQTRSHRSVKCSRGLYKPARGGEWKRDGVVSGECLAPTLPTMNTRFTTSSTDCSAAFYFPFVTSPGVINF